MCYFKVKNYDRRTLAMIRVIVFQFQTEVHRFNLAVKNEKFFNKWR